jgi:hypothetical protein
VPYTVESLALLVARTGVAVAVFQRRLGASVTTSTLDWALPSSTGPSALLEPTHDHDLAALAHELSAS